jgi:hypothetical protein
MSDLLQTACGPPAPTLVLWAPVMSAGAVVLVGLFAGYIAFRQWETARTRVQLDLFERRKPTFDAVAKLLAEITVTGPPTLPALIAFGGATADCRFLFGQDIAAYLSQLSSKADDLVHASRQLEAAATDQERAPFVKANLELMEWFREQYGAYEERFRPYLQLENRDVRISKAALAIARLILERASPLAASLVKGL